MTMRMTYEAVTLASARVGVSKIAQKELVDEVFRARSEEARLLEEATAKDERIKELELALRCAKANLPVGIVLEPVARALAKVSP